MDHQNMIFF